MTLTEHPQKLYRQRAGKSLARLAADLTERGVATSKASLSRVENRKQALNPELLPHLRDLIGLPPEEARPDLAELLGGRSQ